MKEIPWPDLAEMLQQHRTRPHKDGPLWSPVRLDPANPSRANSNVRGLFALVGDVDDHTPPDEFSAPLVADGIEFVIHSTYSYTPGKWKYRIACPFTREVSPEEWEQVWTGFVILYGGGHIDPQCKDKSRPFYWPSVPPKEARDGDWEPWSEYHHGKPLDPDVLKAVVPPPPPRAPRREVQMPQAGDRPTPAVIVDRVRALYENQGRNACGLQIACQLRDNGYSRDEAEATLLDYQQGVEMAGGHPYTMQEALHSVKMAYTRSAREPWESKKIEVVEKPKSAKATWSDVIRAKPWGTARDLMAKNIRPLEWVVPGIIPEGLTLVGGRPKQGKSYGTYGIGLAVALGGMAFGKIPVPQGDVLYLALEDGERRLQDRMRTLLQGGPVPEAFDYATSWSKVAANGSLTPENTPECLSDIEWWLNEHPKARLVIIDTLSRVQRPSKNNGGNSYQEDYEGMTPFQRIAVDRRVGLMVITHTRKPATNKSNSDFLDEIMGTTGITGSADTILGLKKTAPQQLSLMVRGRDVDEQELAIEWCPHTSQWTLLGSVSEVRRSDEQKACIQVLRNADGPLHYRAVAARMGKSDKAGVAAIQTLLWRLSQGGSVVMAGEGFYSAVKGVDHG